jgi:hypothetical protein
LLGLSTIAEPLPPGRNALARLEDREEMTASERELVLSWRKGRMLLARFGATEAELVLQKSER